MTPQDHLALIHRLDCVVCRFRHGHTTPAVEAHHIQYVRDQYSDWATVPLCKACHDLLHQMRRRAFYNLTHLDDAKILALTLKLIEEYYESGR